MRSVAECVSKGSSGPNAYDERKVDQERRPRFDHARITDEPGDLHQRAQRLADVLHVMALARGRGGHRLVQVGQAPRRCHHR